MLPFIRPSARKLSAFFLYCHDAIVTFINYYFIAVMYGMVKDFHPYLHVLRCVLGRERTF